MMSKPLSVLDAQDVPLYSFYDESFAVLKDRFFSTLQDPYPLHCRKMTIKTEKGIGGGMPVWIYKTDLIIEAINRHMEGVFLFADIDIQFFAPTWPVIKKALEGKDMVFQKDPDEKYCIINIGFMGICCNENTLRFWRKVRATITKEQKWDQEVVKNLLMEQRDIPIWGFLPPEIWAYKKSWPWLAAMPAHIVLHHAINAAGPEYKLRQMNVIAIAKNKNHSWRIYRFIYIVCRTEGFRYLFTAFGGFCRRRLQRLGFKSRSGAGLCDF